MIQATRQEIAWFFGCSEKTIETWVRRTYGKKFQEIFQQKRTGGLISLRRAQFQSAMNGNVHMQIWLGKNYLEQKDKKEIDIPTAVPITFVDNLDDENGGTENG